MTPAAFASDDANDPVDRWAAQLALELSRRHGRTELVRKRQQGPLSVQRPFFPEGDVPHLYVLHPPGGVAGGDDLEITISLTEGANGLITTPGATKFYRSRGPDATQRQKLEIADGATLEWFPQENILFPGANVRMATDIRLRGHARIAAWEIHCLGRPAVGERFEPGAIDARLNLYRDDRPILRERLRVKRPEDLDGVSGLRGFPVTATLLMTGADAHTLAAAREVTPTGSRALVHGSTLIEDLLVARVLAADTESVRRLFNALWQVWRPRVLGREACPPRIWAT